jgi:hypothetical protein
MRTDESASTVSEPTPPRGASHDPTPDIRAGHAPPQPPATSTGADEAAPQPDETAARADEAATLLQLATSLKRAYPSVDEVLVDAAVAAAHGAFRDAKIRKYIPVLVERRARHLLDTNLTPDTPPAVSGLDRVGGSS